MKKKERYWKWLKELLLNQALKPAEGSKLAKDEKVVAVENPNKSTQTSAKEVVDEVCPNSEYELKLPDDSNAEQEPLKEPTKHPKPPPVRDRSLGGIDYYTMTYKDPSSDDEIY